MPPVGSSRLNEPPEMKFPDVRTIRIGQFEIPLDRNQGCAT